MMTSLISDYRPVVTNPRLASRMRLSKSSVAALQSFPENNIFYVTK